MYSYTYRMGRILRVCIARDRSWSRERDGCPRPSRRVDTLDHCRVGHVSSGFGRVAHRSVYLRGDEIVHVCTYLHAYTIRSIYLSIYLYIYINICIYLHMCLHISMSLYRPAQRQEHGTERWNTSACLYKHSFVFQSPCWHTWSLPLRSRRLRIWPSGSSKRIPKRGWDCICLHICACIYYTIDLCMYLYIYIYQHMYISAYASTYIYEYIGPHSDKNTERSDEIQVRVCINTHLYFSRRVDTLDHCRFGHVGSGFGRVAHRSVYLRGDAIVYVEYDRRK